MTENELIMLWIFDDESEELLEKGMYATTKAELRKRVGQVVDFRHDPAAPTLAKGVVSQVLKSLNGGEGALDVYLLRSHD